MTINLIKNGELITISELSKSTPIKFFNGDDLIIHEDNLKYILTDKDFDRFKKDGECVFEVSNDRVVYLLYSFLSNTKLLMLNWIGIKICIEQEVGYIFQS